MSTALLTTKLYVPPLRPELVSRPRLIERLSGGLHRKLTLVSAPAGFGKTTLLSEWAAGCDLPVAWLSLDEGDSDLSRFLAYLVAALQTVEDDVGQGVLAALQSPGPVNVEAVLTPLINEIAGLPDHVLLILDDYHVIEAQPVDKALIFLLDNLPPQLHLVIASRIDPSFPLPRLRASGQMTEIRESDLRFTPDEVALFLDRAMGLQLSAENVAALETRTEGWIAGLQLAALAMQPLQSPQGTVSPQGKKQSDDIADFVSSFTGSHRYIQDYLADEVLQQQPRSTQDFLLRTSVLDRLSGPLCDAVRFGEAEPPSSSFGTAVRLGEAEPPSSSFGTAVRLGEAEPPSSSFGTAVRLGEAEPPSSSFGTAVRLGEAEPPSSSFGTAVRLGEAEPPSSSFGTAVRLGEAEPPSSSFGTAVRLGEAEPPSSSEGTAVRLGEVEPPSSSEGTAVRLGEVEPPSSSEGTAVRLGEAKPPSSSEGTAVRLDTAEAHADMRNDSQEILERLEAANLFIVPLDGERRWYRYHHLFADLLRQRLHQQQPDDVAELHVRASAWYEENGLELEAFRHATAANDFQRAARLVEGDGNPLYHRGTVTPVLNWLESLPASKLDANPSLGVMYAEVLMTRGQLARAVEKYRAAEAALQAAPQGGLQDADSRDLLGRIANGLASLAGIERQPETMITLALRALELLRPDNLAIRGAASLSLGFAYELQGDRSAAGQAYAQAIANGQAAGHIIVTILATTSLGDMQAGENQLHQAAQTHRSALRLAGEQPLPYLDEAHLGLARIHYEWNDLDAAQYHGQRAVHLARQIEQPGRSIAAEVFLARLKLARWDVAGAVASLDEVSRSVQQSHLEHCLPEVAAAQVLAFLRQGDLAAAARLAQAHELPISRAQVHLAQGDAEAALAVLKPLRRQMEAKGWQDEILKVMVLQAVALHAHGERDNAVQLLSDALALAEPGGFIRTFIDEGAPMARPMYEAAAREIMPDYTRKLLAAFADATKDERRETERPTSSSVLRPSSLIEPLTRRELEVLQLVAQGLSNREISQRLYLALSTIKGHNRNIFGKLQVQRRTEAVARARELGLL